MAGYVLLGLCSCALVYLPVEGGDAETEKSCCEHYMFMKCMCLQDDT